MTNPLDLSLVLNPEQQERFVSMVGHTDSAINAEEAEALEQLRARFGHQRREARRCLLLQVLGAQTALVSTGSVPVPVQDEAPNGMVRRAPVPKLRQDEAPELVTEEPKPVPIRVKAEDALTRKQLSERLQCHPSSISNWEDAGLIKRIEGTGTGAGNPCLYRALDVPALKIGIEKYQEAGRVAHAAKAKERGKTKPPVVAVSEAAPIPIFDSNDEGKYQSIEEGKATFCKIGTFYLSRFSTDAKWIYQDQPGTSCAEGWELLEMWKRNGLGRWESVSINPGTVGTGNGVTRVGGLSAGIVA